MKSKLKDYKKMMESLKILYAEDDEKVREGGEKFLNKFFSSVTIANNGKKGLEEFQKGSYDIVFSDIKMPKMNGWKMVEKIREIEPNIFVVMLTASRHYEEAESKLCDMYLEKPISLDNMIEVLKKIKEKFNL